ncbi:unnamed protein product [Cuscuta europaea]|uniref:Uncharacterized protein n=1 Tax=Cuscuta europaea TaxID=41803 RepID=A0A9P0ZL59_CUSEU|nr:unnamed protein product [Cuscuta europaea]
MASTVVMQSILGSPLASRSGLAQFAPASCLPRLRRSSNLRVKSMSEDGESIPSPPPPPPAPKPSTDWKKVFSFSGPGPERINGRLAMVGFVSAIGVELANGGDLFNQIANGGDALFIGTSVLLTFASLIPLLQGVTAESKSKGFFSADAEIWNGRFAMVGLVALAFTEYVQNGPLLHV